MIKDYFIDKSFLSLTESQVFGSSDPGPGVPSPRSGRPEIPGPRAQDLGFCVLILDFAVSYIGVFLKKLMIKINSISGDYICFIQENV